MRVFGSVARVAVTCRLPFTVDGLANLRDLNIEYSQRDRCDFPLPVGNRLIELTETEMFNRDIQIQIAALVHIAYEPTVPGLFRFAHPFGRY